MQYALKYGKPLEGVTDCSKRWRQLHKEVDNLSYILKNKSALGRAWDGVHMNREEMKVGEFSTPLQSDKSQSSSIRNHLNEEKFHQVN